MEQRIPLQLYAAHAAACRCNLQLGRPCHVPTISSSSTMWVQLSSPAFCCSHPPTPTPPYSAIPLPPAPQPPVRVHAAQH